MAREPGFARRHRGSILAVGVVVALVAVIAVMDWGSGPSVTESSPSTTRTVMEQKPGVDLSQPFLDTPAAGWPDGEAGIVAPAATQVGAYSPEAVAAGYQRVRQVLITARLDRAVLEGHDVQRYLALLAPDAQAQVGPDLTQPSPDGHAWATRIADGFHLLPVQPKVMGSMWAEQDPDGALLIHTSYIFAYAFDPGGADIVDAMDIVAVDRQDADYTITDTRWPANAQGLWPGKVQAYGYSIACDAYGRGELAPTYSERHQDSTGTEQDEKDAFDPKSLIPTESTCPD